MYYFILYFSIIDGLDLLIREFFIIFNNTEMRIFEQYILESNILTEVNACIY